MGAGMVVLIIFCVLLPAILLSIMLWRKLPFAAEAPPPPPHQPAVAHRENPMFVPPPQQHLHPVPAAGGADYLEPVQGQMAEYDAINAVRGVDDVDGYRIDATSPYNGVGVSNGAEGGALIYDKPGAKGGTLKAPVYAEYASGMENGAAYGPVGEWGVVVQCARGGVPGGWPCTHPVAGGGVSRFCSNHTCNQAGCFNTKSSAATGCNAHGGGSARPRTNTVWDSAGAGNNADAALYTNDAHGNVPGSTTSNVAAGGDLSHYDLKPATAAGGGVVFQNVTATAEEPQPRANRAAGAPTLVLSAAKGGGGGGAECDPQHLGPGRGKRGGKGDC
jgi:hypothetical protein